MVIRFALHLLSLNFFLANLCSAASFDCTKAETNVERLICRDQELSTLDEQLSITFNRALLDVQDPSRIRSEQRTWLRVDRNKCRDVECLYIAYDNRRAELEAITGSFFSTPPPAHINRLCQQLTEIKSRSTILSDTNGIDDINNDGLPERSETCFSGTMHVPCSRYFDRDGHELPIVTVGFEWKDYWTYGVRTFRYRGRTYFLHAFDDYIKEPAYVSYVTPENKEYVLCEFSNQTIPTISLAEQDSRDICYEVLNNKGPNLEYATFDKPPNDPKPFPDDSWQKLEHTGLIDINNDGKKEWVAEISIASGAGRGCDANRYILLGADGAPLGDGLEKRILDELHGQFSEISCGRLSNRLLNIKGKIYFERNVGGSSDYYQHALLLASGKKVKTICAYELTYRTTVKAKQKWGQ